LAVVELVTHHQVLHQLQKEALQYFHQLHLLAVELVVDVEEQEMLQEVLQVVDKIGEEQVELQETCLLQVLHKVMIVEVEHRLQVLLEVLELAVELDLLEVVVDQVQEEMVEMELHLL
tara:strand:- start:215 stop:568 length:354 start_codon:yes stop_codon:yes gene_type:complete